MRANNDAILIGIGTALADDPELTVRGSVQPRVPPTRVVLDRGLRLPVATRLVQSARTTPTIVFANRAHVESPAADALRDAGVVVESADGGLHGVFEAL